MSIKEEAAKMKLASPLMASAPAEKRNSALLHMIENLEAGKEKIFAAPKLSNMNQYENNVNKFQKKFKGRVLS